MRVTWGLGTHAPESGLCCRLLVTWRTVVGRDVYMLRRWYSGWMRMGLESSILLVQTKMGGLISGCLFWLYD